MSKIKDTLEDEQILRDKELEAIEPKYKCEECMDTGIFEKIEWVGTDTSYPVEVKCSCQND